MRINSYTTQLNNNALYNRKNNATQTNFGGIKEIGNAVKKGYGIYNNKLTNGLAYSFGKLAQFKPFQKLINKLKNTNYDEHLAAFVGCVLSGFYMLDIARSKTIEKDQKMPLITNQAVVCAASTTGAYTLNRYLNKKINGIAEIFSISQIQDKALQEEFLKCKADYSYIKNLANSKEANAKWNNIFINLEEKFEYNKTITTYIKEELKVNPNDNIAKKFLKDIKSIKQTAQQEKSLAVKELFLSLINKSKSIETAFNRASMNIAINNYSKECEVLSKMMNGFSRAKTLMVFSLIYRFISPVFATPVANKISGRIEQNKKAKQAA